MRNRSLVSLDFHRRGFGTQSRGRVTYTQTISGLHVAQNSVFVAIYFCFCQKEVSDQ